MKHGGTNKGNHARDLPQIPAGQEILAPPLPPKPASLAPPPVGAQIHMTVRASYPGWLRATALVTSSSKLFFLFVFGLFLSLFELFSSPAAEISYYLLLLLLVSLMVLAVLQVVASFRPRSLTMIISSGILAIADILVLAKIASSLVPELADGNGSDELSIGLISMSSTFCQIGIFLGALRVGTRNVKHTKKKPAAN